MGDVGKRIGMDIYASCHSILNLCCMWDTEKIVGRDVQMMGRSFSSSDLGLGYQNEAKGERREWARSRQEMGFQGWAKK